VGRYDTEGWERKIFLSSKYQQASWGEANELKTAFANEVSWSKCKEETDKKIRGREESISGYRSSSESDWIIDPIHNLGRYSDHDPLSVRAVLKTRFVSS
jgi:hypothetical protein